MDALDIARKLSQLDRPEEALRAYSLVISNDDSPPAAMLEATAYIFYNGGDYQLCFTKFVALYNAGNFQHDIFELLVNAFYVPNEEKIKEQYEKNVRTLSKYEYCFTKDFPAFDDLPIKFFPYNENGFIPFDPETNLFGDYINDKDEPPVTRYFFNDVEDKPLLAKNVFTGYELGYLCDNLRRSEDVAMDNHIYLQYDSLEEFCAYLCTMNIRDHLKTKQLVFLFPGEEAKYPIDFNKDYGIDYSVMVRTPLRVTEIKKLIYYSQFSSHNGLNFFEEILDDHPHLLSIGGAVMTDSIVENIESFHQSCIKYDRIAGSLNAIPIPERGVVNAFLKSMKLSKKPITKKDCLVAFFMHHAEARKTVFNPRIVPSLMLNLHEGSADYLVGNNDKCAIQTNRQFEDARKALGLNKFPYIRTFTPIRNMVSSYGAVLNYIAKHQDVAENNNIPLLTKLLPNRLSYRGYYADPHDKMFRHSCLVRFEDAKLNPKATFTALAEFLDIPYTKSMTYCSLNGKMNPKQFITNTTGFDVTPVYNEYDAYLCEEDKYNLELVTSRDMAFYGYKPHHYDGKAFTRDEIIERLSVPPKKMLSVQRELITAWAAKQTEGETTNLAMLDSDVDPTEAFCSAYTDEMAAALKVILSGKPLVTSSGIPMRLIPWLKPRDELLEQPLYE